MKSGVFLFTLIKMFYSAIIDDLVALYIYVIMNSKTDTASTLYDNCILFFRQNNK